MSSILPRTSDVRYKRVDAGDGRAATRLRFGWKKFAVGAAAVIGLVWLFGPRERREQVLGSIKAPSWSWSGAHDSDGDTLYPTTNVAAPVPQTTNAAGPSKTLPNSPHSPQDDPDPLKTVHCLKPYKPDQRLVQYALMIDAGSTGSRIHIYKFNNCGPSPSYEYEVFRQTKPGLSAFADDPDAAARSLDVLLDEAISVVPDLLHGCTPVAVKATAGLRLLGAEQSQTILNAVRKRLEDEYPFVVVERDGVVIMDGKDEGVYAWITANYLLNTIRGDSPKNTASFAVLDLGGASTQIVFEPEFGDSEPDRAFVEGEHKYELVFGGKTHVLYQHSYLGYGLMQARKSVHRLVEFMAAFNQVKRADGSDPVEIVNPCLAKGTKRVIELEANLNRPGEVARNLTMVGKDVGSYDGCNRVVELVMAKDAICHVKPCSFGGVYQPSILETFRHGNILLLSYFYDRLAPFFPHLYADKPLTVATLGTFAQQVCNGHAEWVSLWGNDAGLIAELEDRPEWCLDLTFMHALLRLGYEFGEDRAVSIEKQVDETELGWCLGATIAIVGGELTCRL